jgi:pimeloyl-ACP methyl ester carboxylesterase
MPRLAALIKSLLRITLTVIMIVVILLLLFQDKLIYHPHPYHPGELASHPRIIPVAYVTSQGPQQSYYLPPRATPVRRLWVVFPGNGSCALDWASYLEAAPDSHDAFLLIDYPGYGASSGHPSPAAIQESAQAAYAHLAASPATQPAALLPSVNLFCHSLAAGLNFAVQHPVDRIVLFAPFTSLRDMARRRVGWPLCYLLRHNFDNRARLAALAARPHLPRVTIFHGTDDTVIPISMSRSLAAAHPAMITFNPVPGAGHNTILQDAALQVTAALTP